MTFWRRTHRYTKNSVQIDEYQKHLQSLQGAQKFKKSTILIMYFFALHVFNSLYKTCYTSFKCVHRSCIMWLRYNIYTHNIIIKLQ